MQKLCAFCMVVLLILNGTVYAEEQLSTEELVSFDYSDAYELIQNANVQLMNMMELSSDANSTNVLLKCSQELTGIELGMLSAEASSIDIKEKAVSELPANSAYVEENVICRHIPSTYVEFYDYMQEFDVVTSKNYSRIDYNVYAKETGNFGMYARLEIATRENSEEIILLYSTYKEKGIYKVSERYLVHVDGNNCNTLYYNTLGKDMEFQISPYLWSAGTDYTWEEALLYAKY